MGEKEKEKEKQAKTSHPEHVTQEIHSGIRNAKHPIESVPGDAERGRVMEQWGTSYQQSVIFDWGKPEKVKKEIIVYGEGRLLELLGGHDEIFVRNPCVRTEMVPIGTRRDKWANRRTICSFRTTRCRSVCIYAIERRSRGRSEVYRRNSPKRSRSMWHIRRRKFEVGSPTTGEG